MSVESATYINQLDSAKPTGSDLKSEGDNHLRLLKSTVKATFPNVAGAVTPTHTELNYVDGVTSAIQTQLDAKLGSSVTVPVDIAVSSSSTALTVTQSGSGNALVVNDATSDTTPFVIDNSGSVKVGGGQSLTVQPTANAFDTLTSFSVQATAVSEAVREFVGNFGLISNKGWEIATPGEPNYQPSTPWNKDKVALYAGVQAQAGTGDVWAFNPVTVLDSGSAPDYQYNAYIIEADLMNSVGHRGDTPGEAGIFAPISWGQAITAAGDYRNTGALWITGGTTTGSNPVWNRGIVFSANSIEQSSIADYTQSDTVLDVQGSHKTGVSLTGYLTGDGSSNTYGFKNLSAINTSANNVAASFYSSPQTDTSGSFTAIQHYSANNAVKNGSATLASQYGFIVSDLTSATSGANFGFYSGVNGANWAFYAAGSAASYFGGGILTTGLNNTGSSSIGDSESADSHVVKGITTMTGSSATTALTVTQIGAGGALDVIGPTQFFGTIALGNQAHATTQTTGTNNTSVATTAFVQTENALKANIASPALTGNVSVSTNSASPALLVTQEGSGNALEVRDVASDTTPFVVDANGNIGVGLPALSAASVRIGPSSAADAVKYGALYDGTVLSGTTTWVSTLSQPSTVAASFTVSNLTHFRASQGTFGAGSSVTSQYGYLAASSLTGATNNYGFYSDIASGANRWNFYAAGTAANYFGGNVTVGGGGTLGYGAGSGGTVTQVTSRTTGVTVNKPSGEITLVSAAGSATYQTFTVTNSAVSATDSVIASQKSGTDLYEIHITNVAAGSFKVTFRTTGGTTTEQPVIRFDVFKGATA